LIRDASQKRREPNVILGKVYQGTHGWQGGDDSAAAISRSPTACG